MMRLLTSDYNALTWAENLLVSQNSIDGILGLIQELLECLELLGFFLFCDLFFVQPCHLTGIVFKLTAKIIIQLEFINVICFTFPCSGGFITYCIN